VDRVARVGDDAAAVRAAGIEIASELCDRLLDGGAPGLHFYTPNRSTATREIFQNPRPHWLTSRHFVPTFTWDGVTSNGVEPIGSDPEPLEAHPRPRAETASGTLVPTPGWVAAFDASPICRMRASTERVISIRHGATTRHLRCPAAILTA